VARLFGTSLVSSLTIGLTISITAVPVNAIILMELGLLDTELGATVIEAGVIDDIISFIALSMIQQFSAGGSVAEIATIGIALVKVIVFLGILFALEHYLRTNSSRVRGGMERLTSHMRTPGSYFALLLICTVGVSLLAEWSGIQLVIGAFFAGFLLSEVIGNERLKKADDIVRGSTLGFFVPIAFTFIGTEFILQSIIAMPLFLVLLLVAAIASKLLGGTLAAKLVRFPNSESVIIGFLMNSRGFVELVIASTAFGLGLIDQSLFLLVVAVGILATIISPAATRIVLARRKALHVPVSMTTVRAPSSDPESY
jgi:Kef-type K+ transport system membrane component KefB